ncbi:cellulose synthase-like protein E6 [Salvia miltiorrhiza]|uniref:cellulose synthase-like protein E6 n=1 Tax=Salvia miltiorrhiza TaxID=226208 RepID=UPI0025AD29F6|nr:cellulose synthase-like protein E6 [Salvia miltiorrhiza]
MRGDGDLFETRAARGRAAHRALCITVLAGIVSVWVYRLGHIPQGGRYSWIAMLCAELLFGFYWIISQSGRWTVVYRYPFKDRLSSRYGEKLPAVDVFVCTADPVLEPPSLVVSTVLSVMSYNYPSQKLSVYLSDDGGSQLTFYALFEASTFSKYWIPFSKKYNVEPRSPAIYFSQTIVVDDSSFAREWANVKQLYEEMKGRIDSAAAKGCVPEHIRNQHKGFSEWNSKVEKQDHQSILQILIDGWNPEATDVEGNRLPTLVYLSREKRPGWPHNFKAGSMNALIRVSSEISNAPIILNVDCDMYSNDPDAINDALCFFLDEKHGSQTCYVQYPQQYNNITKNDIYGNQNFATNDIELSGLDGFGVALYVGTGCFHRRESLSGKKFSVNHRIESGDVEDNIKGKSKEELENTAKVLANCSYEKGTSWGKEMGLVYGCPVEDIVTGLSIQCRGWKPVYYNPSKHAFKGVAPTTLDVSLIQFTRWSEGMFQIFLSKYCPFILGRGKISFGGQMGYCIYLLWPMLSLPTLCYAIIPALALLRDVPLFPKVSSFWIIPFAYVFTAKTAYSLAEDVAVGDTLKGWWNVQRMVVIRRVTAYFLALIETVMRVVGLSQSAFVLTAKVVDDEAEKRYRKGLIEFGSSSIMMIIIATLALLNLFALGWGAVKLCCASEAFDKLLPQLAICGVWVMLNLPVYEAFFCRRDKGSMPLPVTFKSLVIASTAVLVSVY